MLWYCWRNIKKNTLLRFYGVLNVIVENYKKGYKSILCAIKGYDSISNIDGIIGSYIDLFFCQKIVERNSHKFKFVDEEINKKIDYIISLINEEVILIKHADNYALFVSFKHEGAC